MNNLDPLAAWYLFIFGVFVPYLAIQSSRKVKAGAPIPPKKKVFLNTVLMEICFLAIALYVARSRGIDVFVRGTLSWNAILLALAIFAIALGTLPLRWKLSSDESKKRLLRSRPETANDLGGWFAL